MITTKCICGEAIEAPETYVNQRTLCPVCETKLRFVSTERLADGAGAADFDARLLIISGPAGEGEQLFLGGVHEIVMGSSQGCQIHLPSNAVAEQHCKLMRMDFGPSRWRLVAEEMNAPVLANGHQVAERELRDGDAIVIGDFEFQFASILSEPVTPVDPSAPPAETLGPTCPSCRQKLPNRARICIHCGINIVTGKPIVMSKGLDEDALAERTDLSLRALSFVMPFGILPIASEAFGTRKPTATWIIAAITILTSLIFVIAVHSDEMSVTTQNLKQWNGSRAVSMQKLAQLQPILDPDHTWKPGSGELPPINPRTLSPDTLHQLIEVAPALLYPPTVKFHLYQLLTAAFLHDPRLLLPFVFHLGGNLLFFFIFGMRINELIGNVKMSIIYPLLAIAASSVDHIAHLNDPLQSGLGASGAIMGLAGMYLILFPVQRVHMAAWLRILPIPGVRCLRITWKMRGFWLLVLWVAWHDLVPVIFHFGDHVSHWAHIGGFASGVIIATFLLVTRSINAKGSDIFSVTLGKKAWSLVGRPQHWHA